MEFKDGDETHPEATPKHTRSEKQSEASRRNGRKSPGPVTRRGKDIVAKNAITHGLSCQNVVIEDRDGKESKEDFAALQAAVLDHYQPADFLEKMWVAKVVHCLWR